MCSQWLEVVALVVGCGRRAEFVGHAELVSPACEVVKVDCRPLNPNHGDNIAELLIGVGSLRPLQLGKNRVLRSCDVCRDAANDYWQAAT